MVLHLGCLLIVDHLEFIKFIKKLNKCTMCRKCLNDTMISNKVILIGAGSMLTKTTLEKGTYNGTPARKRINTIT